MIEKDKYFDLLSTKFQSSDEIVSEIINLKAILDLPKGTEHFVSDLHGEYSAFQHILRNGSGNIKEKIKDLFHQTLTSEEQKELATLIYYPEKRLKVITLQTSEEWYKTTIDQLIQLIRFCSSKYTRSKLRKTFPNRFSYIIEELLSETNAHNDKKNYTNQIIDNIISLNQADKLIIDLSYIIQRLVVDHLHVVGDIYDRGPEPDKIIERLMTHHSLDIQWGNHDIIWIGAAAGSPICMMNTIRISARYNNLSIIEDTYGINLRPLLTYAEKYYEDNPAFRPKLEADHTFSEEEILETTKIHQAAAILQFKLEEQLVKRRPEFMMEHRFLLSKTDFDNQTITIKNQTYDLHNTCFNTVNPEAPSELTTEEAEVIERLLHNFIYSEKLKRHMNFLLEKGNMYLVHNENLLIHGCVPLKEDGSFQSIQLNGINYNGKALLDFFEVSLRKAYQTPHIPDNYETDALWYLWSGECSSLFGKKEMTTFERYFIKEKETHIEEKNAYYALREEEETIRNILAEFGLKGTDSHLINGHTPIKEIKGENPIKANGKLIVIDGGFSKPYQKTTGLAGYTLLYNSYGMQLVAHKPFSSIKQVIEEQDDILSMKRLVDRPVERKLVKDTSVGRKLQNEIDELQYLLDYVNYYYQK
ncbi:fructose-1,6-bisphosphatase-3 [Vagococcus fluvialis]|uniref:Fructose-1,6-bisphosphatase class 3 n=1 Tax=Vagococcus fluvialis TaxID=2738 RepID=A0A369ATX6_9ENTE|nr:fructose-1,6-bisphosphatase [Vagococcus fluvialis]RCX12830.1 fructose-1,6-bisphosphatase-3 [Vagococcus fluvialis]RSU01298.1 fructose-bisphosphatase class III [Vagococcus fluvialis]UDM74029.1 fructose-1,6-bisphosphatase [Vagococcus fluvialis]WNF90697.1 fructose-1,6-bisphosphatase [Vagococcus fluvialis]